MKSKKASANVFKGMLILAKGAVVARMVGVLSIPVLARIYSPEDFGVLALYTALVLVLAPMLTLRYVQAIPLPKTDAMAINLLVVCLKLIFFGALILVLVFSIFGSVLLGWFDMQSLVPWWPLLILGVAGTALYELFSLWATRKKQYKVLASTQVVQSLMGNVTKVALGLLALKPAGLLIGQFVAQSGGVASFVKQSLNDFVKLKPKIQKKKGTFVVKYYRHFPYYRLPSQVLMVLSVQSPVLMMAALYDKEVTGHLSLAMMALSLPTSLIGAAVAKAYYAEVAMLGRNNIKQIKRITIDVQKKLFLVGLPLTVLAVLLAEPAFAIVFGERWAVAGRFASILAPFMLFQFTSAPLMEVINVVGKQINFLIIHFLRVLGLVGLFCLFKFMGFLSIYFVVAMSIYLSFFYFLVSGFVLLSLKR